MYKCFVSIIYSIDAHEKERKQNELDLFHNIFVKLIFWKKKLKVEDFNWLEQLIL